MQGRSKHHNTVVRVLRGAKQRLARGGRCKSAYAMNEYGQAVNPQAIDACRWCIAGAVHAESSNPEVISQALMVLVDQTPAKYTSNTQFNDATTSDALVLQVFDMAINSLVGPTGVMG